MPLMELIVFILNKMEFKVYKAVKGNLTFKIEEDFPEIGVYYFVFENENNIYDDLQNSVADCQEIILEKYGIQLSEWSEIDPIII